MEHFKYSFLFELLLIAQAIENLRQSPSSILLIKRDPNISLVEISNLAQLMAINNTFAFNTCATFCAN